MPAFRMRAFGRGTVVFRLELIAAALLESAHDAVLTFFFFKKPKEAK